MEITFDDNQKHLALAPLTLTRPVAELRVGIDTIRESWLYYLSQQFEITAVSYITEEYLTAKYEAPKNSNLTIMGNIKPVAVIADLVGNLEDNQALYVNGVKVAFRDEPKERVDYKIDEEQFIHIEHPWQLFQFNGAAIREDFTYLTKDKSSNPLNATNTVVGEQQIFVEEGAKVSCSILNAENGPIYIGKDAEIMEGCIIRGPFALGEKAVLKMGAKIYGDTTIGTYCKVGGEVTNSIFYAYSNKGHDGFVGNSVIGEWCNLGADTNTSNLKNNYSNVRVYSYEKEEMINTEVTFCGSIMGDHVKTGINTMLNTATVIGVCSNIFGGGFPPKYIPSYTWGAAESSDLFRIDKAFEVANNMMKRRNLELTAADRHILTHLFKELA